MLYIITSRAKDEVIIEAICDDIDNAHLQLRDTVNGWLHSIEGSRRKSKDAIGHKIQIIGGRDTVEIELHKVPSGCCHFDPHQWEVMKENIW